MVKQVFLAVVSSIFLMSFPAFAEPDVTLTTEQKLAVYEQKKQNPVAFVLLNTVPFGVGSFTQGDISAGATIATIDAISLSLIAVNYFLIDGYSGLALGLAGINGLVVGRALSIGGPITYSANQNNALRRELGLEPSKPEPYYNWTTNLFSYSTNF